jgi:hypothetical protein
MEARSRIPQAQDQTDFHSVIPTPTPVIPTLTPSSRLSLGHPERSRGTLRIAPPTRTRIPPRHQSGRRLQDGAPRRYVHQHPAIHTLQSMIRAMGGQLKIEAVFPESKVEINQFRKLKKATGAVPWGKFGALLLGEEETYSGEFRGVKGGGQKYPPLQVRIVRSLRGLGWV